MAHAGFPKGLNTTIEKISELLKKDTVDNRRLIIECDNIPIGEMSYGKIEDSVAEIGIKICDSTYHDKGYGPRFLKMLINYLFNELNYNKIILDTNLENTRAQHVYEKIGFKKIRTRYDSWKDQLGNLQSSIDYELTKDDFQRI